MHPFVVRLNGESVTVLKRSCMWAWELHHDPGIARRGGASGKERRVGKLGIPGLGDSARSKDGTQGKLEEDQIQHVLWQGIDGWWREWL